MRHCRIVWLSMVLVAVLFAGAPAPAATVSFPAFSAQTNSFYYLGPQTSSFQLPKFRSDVGTLQGMRFDFHFDYTPETGVDNPTNVFQGVTTATSTMPLLLTFATDEVAFDAVNAWHGVAQIFGPSVNNRLIGAMSFVDLPSYDVLPADFVAYVSPGPSTQFTTFTLHYGAGPAGGSNANLVYTAGASARARAVVTYDYLPVPEPGAGLLLLVGGLLLIARTTRMRFVDGDRPVS
ncbi:MAG: choice-of-anchor E domain-containing protein [Pirellulales bacterium]